MVTIHKTYSKERFEKLCGMFGDDPRYGNPALYVKEHFNLKRICENCETRGTSKYLVAASVIVEGDSWVVPISVTCTGVIVLDLETSIPDQSNFLLCEPAMRGLEEIGIRCDLGGRIEYVVPISSSRDEYYRDRRKGRLRRRRADYEFMRTQFTCNVIVNASVHDVLKWNTEVEYDFEAYWQAKSGEQKGAQSAELDYFLWLAEHGHLVVSRISDENDATLAIAYFVKGEYELSAIIGKRLTEPRYLKYGFGNALVFMILDHIYDNALLTPLNLGSVLHQHKEIWRPAPVVKPQLAFVDAAGHQDLLQRLGEL